MPFAHNKGKQNRICMPISPKITDISTEFKQRGKFYQLYILVMTLAAQTEKQQLLKNESAPLFNNSSYEACLFCYINTHPGLLQCPICHPIYGNADIGVQFWQLANSCHATTEYIIGHTLHGQAPEERQLPR